MEAKVKLVGAEPTAALETCDKAPSALTENTRIWFKPWSATNRKLPLESRIMGPGAMPAGVRGNFSVKAPEVKSMSSRAFDHETVNECNLRACSRE